MCRGFLGPNVCNICMPQAICDVISSIGISIGAAAADSIGHRVPARYQSNPSSRVNKVTVRISLVLVIGWTNETKPNPNPNTNPNRNPTKPYHLTQQLYVPLISTYAPTLSLP